LDLAGNGCIRVQAVGGMGGANQSNNTQEQEVALKVGGGNHLSVSVQRNLSIVFFLLPSPTFEDNFDHWTPYTEVAKRKRWNEHKRIGHPHIGETHRDSHPVSSQK